MFEKAQLVWKQQDNALMAREAKLFREFVEAATIDIERDLTVRESPILLSIRQDLGEDRFYTLGVIHTDIVRKLQGMRKWANEYAKTCGVLP